MKLWLRSQSCPNNADWAQTWIKIADRVPRAAEHCTSPHRTTRNAFALPRKRRGGMLLNFKLDDLTRVQGRSGEINLETLNWGNYDLVVIDESHNFRNASSATLDQEKPYELWRKAFDWQPEKYQVLTPHRGEAHGVAALNDAMQKRIARGIMARFGAVDGITLFDKVIQYRNRPKSNPIWAYSFNTRKSERAEIFIGEIGFVQKHGYDTKKNRFRMKRFQVKFARKDHLGVGYGRELGNGGSESVESNLELAYAISIHKAQGSEFSHTDVLIPRAKGHSLSSELIYTAEAVWKRCPVVSLREAAGGRDGRFHRRHRPGTGHAFP